MEREPYEIARLASMLIHFLTTVGVTEEEGIKILKAAERLLARAGH